MPSNIKKLSYTGRDASEIRRELIDMIPGLTDKWTDFNESDLGIILIELIAGAQDMQNFYFDTQTFETYLDTAVQDKNIRSLLRTMNYRIPLINNAKGTLFITFINDEYKEINIPKYTYVRSSIPGVRATYLVNDTISLSGNISEIEIPIVEGELKTLTMTRNDFETNYTVSHEISRRIYLGFSNVADHSVTLSQSGVVWEECDDALLKYNGGYYYSVHKDSSGQVYVLMSVNFLSLLPQDKDSSIVFNFIVSRGSQGNVNAYDLDTIDTALDDVQYIENREKTTGGTDEPNLSDLKLLARRNAITMDRYITLYDYETAVNMEPYILKSVVKDWKYPEYVNEPYLVRIWAVGPDGEQLNKIDKEKLKEKLLSKGNVEVSVEVMNVNIVDIDIEIDVTLKVRDSVDKENIRKSIEDYLYRVYRVSSMEFGGEINYAALLSRVKASSPYIKDAIILKPTESIEVGIKEFPRVKNIKVNVVDKI